MNPDKLKILLIDDEPHSLRKPGTTAPSLEIGFNDENKDFPQHLVGEYFQLCWLQSPRDVREFRSLTGELIREHGYTALSADGFVPEIVLFDYKLSNGMKNFIDLEREYADEMESYMTLIPTYRLSRRLGRTTHRFPDWEQLKGELEEAVRAAEAQFPAKATADILQIAKGMVKWDEAERLDEPEIFFDDKDDMGCYAGGLITLQFKDHPCIGIPITSKEGLTDVSHDALYFEWLLSEDFDHQFGKKYGKSPFWDEIIPVAVHMLRERIKSLVKTGRVITDYVQLTRLSAGQNDAGVFSFISTYGVRHLPLDGLFIDIPEAKRAQEVTDWAKALLESLPNEIAEIDKATGVSEMLWGEYIKRFGPRMELSTLAYWSEKRELTRDEQERFENLKVEFGVVDGKIKNEVSVQELFTGIDTKVNFTVRLATLHLVTRAAIEMNKHKKAAPDKAIYREHDKYEYFNILFPTFNHKKGKELLLSLNEESETDKSRLIEGGVKWLHKRLGVPGGDWDNFEAWITPGEKLLLKHLFFSLDDYYPSWLK